MTDLEWTDEDDTPMIEEEILRRYPQGESLTSIARSLGRSENRVHKIARTLEVRGLIRIRSISESRRKRKG